MDNREDLREELEEYLQGLVICDDISKDDKYEILDDFDNWCVTAKDGDTYYYDAMEFTLEVEEDREY